MSEQSRHACHFWSIDRAECCRKHVDGDFGAGGCFLKSAMGQWPHADKEERQAGERLSAYTECSTGFGFIKVK